LARFSGVVYRNSVSAKIVVLDKEELEEFRAPQYLLIAAHVALPAKIEPSRADIEALAKIFNDSGSPSRNGWSAARIGTRSFLTIL
jgi:hypothetical protein